MPPGMEFPALPAPNAPAAAPPNTAWVQKAAADLVALNKIDEHTARFSVIVGQTVTFYQLSITVRACVVRPVDQPADSATYLDITDAHPTQPGFHGWMLSNEPAASMLQHPVYDVRVSGCH